METEEQPVQMDSVEKRSNRRRQLKVVGVAAAVALLVGCIWWLYPKSSTAATPKALVAQEVTKTEPTKVVAVDPPKTEVAVPARVPKPETKAEKKSEGKPAKKVLRRVAAKAAKTQMESPTQPVSVLEDWKHPGAAPYAKTFEEACRKGPQAIEGFSRMPVMVQKYFRVAIGADCKSLVKDEFITPGQRLEQMHSGGPKVHLMETPTFAELPVAKSPDGLAYRVGSMAETAKARVWRFDYEGKTYVLYLPYVCFNWAWAIEKPRSDEECYEVSFVPTQGHLDWSLSTIGTEFPASSCNAIRKGNGKWQAWYGDCAWCTPNMLVVEQTLGVGARPYRKYRIAVEEDQYVLRFSKEVAKALVSFCLDTFDENDSSRAKGKKSCGVYVVPGDWKGVRKVIIPNDEWLLDNGSCPK